MVAAAAFTAAVASMAAAVASKAAAVACMAAVLASKAAVRSTTAFASAGKAAVSSTTAFASAAKAAVRSTTAFPSAAGASAKVGTAATTMKGGRRRTSASERRTVQADLWFFGPSMPNLSPRVVVHRKAGRCMSVADLKRLVMARITWPDWGRIRSAPFHSARDVRENADLDGPSTAQKPPPDALDQVPLGSVPSPAGAPKTAPPRMPPSRLPWDIP
jgi:hypothetical protein